MFLSLALTLGHFVACVQQDEVSQSPGSDTDTGGGDWSSATAPLQSLSSAECPDLSETNTGSFVSSGEDRTVTVVIPEDTEGPYNVVVFFHGLEYVTAGSSPTDSWSSYLGLQNLADETGTVFFLPESPTWNIQDFDIGISYDMEFYLWDVFDFTDHDVVLFDDLRTCAGENLDVDLERLSIMGFSGGALFNTVIARERGDTLASMVSMSGGSDVEALGYEVSTYGAPASKVPSLLVSGGDSDVWPSASYKLVDFAAATDNLEAGLSGDDHLVVRCKHDSGHTAIQPEIAFAGDWVLAHTYGEASPYEADGIGEHESWCEVASNSD